MKSASVRGGGWSGASSYRKSVYREVNLPPEVCMAGCAGVELEDVVGEVA